MTISASDILNAWRLSTAAYDDNSNALLADLSRTVWQPLGSDPVATGPFQGQELSSPASLPIWEFWDTYFGLGVGDSNFVFDNGTSQAFVARNATDNSIAIAFTGSDMFDALTDWNGLNGANTFESEYANFHYLTESLATYIVDNHITKVLVTGHSLGGAMAEWFMSQHSDGNGVAYVGITFGSPGDVQLIGVADHRLINLGHSEDAVFNAAAGWVLGPGDVDVDLTYTTGFPQSFDGLTAFALHYAATLGDTAEHDYRFLYGSTTFDIAESSLFGSFISNPHSYHVDIGTNSGGDYLVGTVDGSDFILGLNSDDRLDGLSGNDLIDGGRGADFLTGGSGADVLAGGSSSDTFAFDSTAVIDASNSIFDRISDYDQGNSYTHTYAAVEGDLIDLKYIYFNTDTGHATASLVRAREDVTHAFSILQINPSNTSNEADWLTIARLDGVHAGNTLDLLLDTSQAMQTTVEPTGGNPTSPSSWAIPPGTNSVTESNTDIVFTVTRSMTTQEQTVYVSTTINHGSLNQGDYNYWLNKAVTFAVGQSSYDVTIHINDDGLVENNETFGLIVQTSSTDPVSRYLASATFTINDNDTAPPDPGPGVSWNGTVDSEVWNGTSGNDSANGNGGNDTLIGNDGNDNLFASAGNNVLSGGDGNDYFNVSGGNNTLLGGNGNDAIIVSGAGTNQIDGGAGIDTLHLERPDLTQSVTVNVVSDGNGSTYAFSLPDGGNASGIELLMLRTGSGDDHVTFANTTTPGSQYWDGGDGNDSAVVDFSAFSSNVQASDSNGGAYLIGTQYVSYVGYAYQVSLNNVENVTLYGGAGNDTLYCSSGNKILSGGDGNDYFSITGGNNTLLGGDGNDAIVVSGPGTNQIDGGAGIDTLYLYRPDLTQAVTVNSVSDGNGSAYAFSLPDGGSVSGIELLNLQTGSGDDQVTFANTTIAGSQYWDGGAGNDSAVVDFSAFSSNVQASDSNGGGYLIGTQYVSYVGYAYQVSLNNVENVTVFGGAGNDSLQRSYGDNTLFGNDGNDALYAGAGNDYLSGGAGNDYLQDSGGNNTLLGGDGNDTISISGPGTSQIDGGAGIDTLWLYRSDLTQAVTVNVVSDGNGSIQSFSLPDGTSVSGIELLNLATGSGDDQVTLANTVIAGSQSWDGGAGNDRAVVDFSAFSSDVYANYGNNYNTYRIGTQGSGNPYTYEAWLYNVEDITLYGGAGNDSLARTYGNNTLMGNDGNDMLYGGYGNDSLSGGAGNDYLSDGYSNNTLLGGDGNDAIIVTGQGANQIDGGAGNDTLTGGLGNDNLEGGSGFDTALYSGNRADYTIDQGTWYHYTITDNNPDDGNDGIDTVFGIEQVQFADTSMSLQTSGSWHGFKHRPVTPFWASTDWNVVDSQHDFNADSKNDVLLGKPDGSIALWLMDGSTRIAGVIFDPSPGRTLLDATADYNGDGKTDLKWHESDGSNSYWLMDSGWTMTI